MDEIVTLCDRRWAVPVQSARRNAADGVSSRSISRTGTVAGTHRALPARLHGIIGTLAILLSFLSAVAMFLKLQDLGEESRQVVSVGWGSVTNGSRTTDGARSAASGRAGGVFRAVLVDPPEFPPRASTVSTAMVARSGRRQRIGQNLRPFQPT